MSIGGTGDCSADSRRRLRVNGGSPTFLVFAGTESFSRLAPGARESIGGTGDCSADSRRRLRVNGGSPTFLVLAGTDSFSGRARGGDDLDEQGCRRGDGGPSAPSL